ncbi:ATP-binding protein [Stenomitos frigidus]|uniref:ATP-binding protein n=1 Tax=Stenomitos frigidus TaxID=1886765 RepID=UPI001C63176F|nr:ATP-binding protein [Stenomitos frigidus]
MFFTQETALNLPQKGWKILIVDDEAEVHQVTELALSDFVLEGRTLNFIHAYSGQEAKQLIQAHPDTAVIFLDVVMETDDAGLQVVKYIREELGNQLVRIILRTGQPGQAPESLVVVNYGIDDYKTKTELTSQRMFISIVTALRAFSTFMKALETSHNLELEILQRKEIEAALRISEANEREKAEQLERSLHQLQHTQVQLVQSEKMSTLGQLVAGVAHEINNPVNFIHGNLTHANEYMQDLLDLLMLYQAEYPTPTAAVQAKAMAIEVEFLTQDLPKLLASMRVGTERIREIVKSLRIFSRLDEADAKAVDLHDGIDSTLLILDNRLKACSAHEAIAVVKEYGVLPHVECCGGQLNQVFMNILSNAIDALEDSMRAGAQRIISEPGAIGAPPQLTPTIYIRTQVSEPGWVMIQIADNGPGMPETVRQRLFEPFFTTKELGRGTGLGMSISAQIVTEKHNGSLQCFSTLEQGTEFVLKLPIQQPQ